MKIKIIRENTKVNCEQKKRQMCRPRKIHKYYNKIHT